MIIAEVHDLQVLKKKQVVWKRASEEIMRMVQDS